MSNIPVMGYITTILYDMGIIERAHILTAPRKGRASINVVYLHLHTNLINLFVWTTIY